MSLRLSGMTNKLMLFANTDSFSFHLITPLKCLIRKHKTFSLRESSFLPSSFHNYSLAPRSLSSVEDSRFVNMEILLPIVNNQMSVNQLSL